MAERIQADYVADVEKKLFEEPTLAHWRLSLGLEALLVRQRELEQAVADEGQQTRGVLHEELASLGLQLAAIAAQFRRFAHDQAGRYDQARLERALARYRELALESVDIIGLANLPEGDRNLAAKRLELRGLYVPLKVREERGALDAEAMELRRDAARHVAAGRHGDGADADDDALRSTGDVLAQRQRVVVLGDPGAGKTTIMRWIATAYLLRLKHDPGFADLPDVTSLPERDWLPVVIRCRDLDDDSLNGALDDVLRQTFRKSELEPDLVDALQVGLRDRLADGGALLLIDGLDEIASARVRSAFSRQLERIAAAYPQAPMLVSSRIVGYREMGQDLGRGFTHVVVTDLDREGKDRFAERWCALTEPPERQERAQRELIHAIHSSDRIERLTGNPMLLTTLALVKRKVGKLPTRRADLYWEAVHVLLNWRAEVDEPVDDREAIPQLEYLAYEMCRRGVQRMPRDEILDLWERMREEHTRIRPLRNHSPEEFLTLLERRTGLLVEAGHERHGGRPVPVYEFRHLTIQEYLAALAMVDGRWPGYDKNESLAEHVGRLAGEVEEVNDEFVVAERWRESLRLCVSCCDEREVDDVMVAILGLDAPAGEEDLVYPRAVLASACLADEPNVGDETANTVLRRFSTLARDAEFFDKSYLETVDALIDSGWMDRLRTLFAEEFLTRPSSFRASVGSLCSHLSVRELDDDQDIDQGQVGTWVQELGAVDTVTAVQAALRIMGMAFAERVKFDPDMVEALFVLADRGMPEAHAATWAMAWLSGTRRPYRKPGWRPESADTARLLGLVRRWAADPEVVYWALNVIPVVPDEQTAAELSSWVFSSETRPQQAAIGLFAESDGEAVLKALRLGLEDSRSRTRSACLGAVAWKASLDETSRRLLAPNFYPYDLKYGFGFFSWIDPDELIDDDRVNDAAEKLEVSVEEVRQRYQDLAPNLGLRLSWN
ncbi:MAG: NACHT domain-containing protein [Gammaproteobacteria bacterium]|nr:NACHT domain-containing protein [Gammaproteobacteria bacterium]